MGGVASGPKAKVVPDETSVPVGSLIQEVLDLAREDGYSPGVFKIGGEVIVSRDDHSGGG
jgi:hypothetical protein